MSAWAAAAAAGSVGAVALVSRRLAPTPVSGPMLLVAAGLACGPVGLDLLDLSRDSAAVELLLEVALVASCSPTLPTSAGRCCGATTRSHSGSWAWGCR